MEKVLVQILEKLTNLGTGQDKLEKKLTNLETGQDTIKGQLDENTQLIKALLHSTEELDAKYDSLLHTTATRDSIVDIKAGIQVINKRLFEQETKLEKIELAK